MLAWQERDCVCVRTRARRKADPHVEMVLGDECLVDLEGSVLISSRATPTQRTSRPVSLSGRT